MPRYICVMKLDADNRVSKFSEQVSKEAADAHVADHVGSYPDAFVYEDSDASDVGEWQFDAGKVTVADRAYYPKPEKIITNNIRALEQQETPRRIAEATLTAEGKAWLQANRDAIALERAKL